MNSMAEQKTGKRTFLTEEQKKELIDLYLSANYSRLQLADKFGVCLEIIGDIIKANNLPRTHAQIKANRVVELHKKGMSAIAIADKVGVNRNSVNTIIAAYKKNIPVDTTKTISSLKRKLKEDIEYDHNASLMHFLGK